MSIFTNNVFGSQIDIAIQHKLVKKQSLDLTNQTPFVRMWTAVEVQQWEDQGTEASTLEELIKKKGQKTLDR